ncbi:MAG: tetratricopeptide repeat protein [bacterium]
MRTILGIALALSIAASASLGQDDAPSRERKAEIHYRDAIVFYKIQYRDDTVIKELKAITDQYSDTSWDDDARYMIGYFYQFESENYALAIEAYKDFLGRYPNHDYAPLVLKNIGDCYYHLKNFSSAIEVYNDFLNRYPENKMRGEVLYRLGRSYTRRGDYEMAISAYQKVVEIRENPLSDDAQFQIAIVYQIRGDIASAMATYKRMPIDFPQSPLVEKANVQISLLDRILRSQQQRGEASGSPGERSE